MTQRSFDPDTSREMVGDERAREIESKARVDADAGEGAYDPPNRYSQTATFWGKTTAKFEEVVYQHQFMKRMERNKRKAHGRDDPLDQLEVGKWRREFINGMGLGPKKNAELLLIRLYSTPIDHWSWDPEHVEAHHGELLRHNKITDFNEWVNSLRCEIKKAKCPA